MYHAYGKPGGTRPLGRPRHKWEDNIEMGRKEIGCEEVEWIYLAMDEVQWCALVNTVMNLQVLGQLSTLSSIQELYSLDCCSINVTLVLVSGLQHRPGSNRTVLW
jgi:hypothetical protein